MISLGRCTTVFRYLFLEVGRFDLVFIKLSGSALTL